MLDLLDKLIAAVLDAGWASSPARPGFYFSIPDDDWKQRVNNGPTRLNIYCYEMRENRDFRRPQWDIVPDTGGELLRSQPPVYFDWHYLISAWSPTTDNEITSPIPDEHKVLSEALRVLLCSPIVRAMDLGVTGGGPVFQEAEVTLNVAPPETPRVLNDFWSTMKQPWRPAIQLIATAPLDLTHDEKTGPAVTTLVQAYRITGAVNPEERITIGGWVLKQADDTPIQNAVVSIQGVDGAFTTDETGRYIFTGLSPGTYSFTVQAAGMTTINRNMDLPSATSEEHIFRMRP
jgi:hypothetical protein